MTTTSFDDIWMMDSNFIVTIYGTWSSAVYSTVTLISPFAAFTET